MLLGKAVDHARRNDDIAFFILTCSGVVCDFSSIHDSRFYHRTFL